eukprot:CAMPEP_0194227268 /NCGR_PEP_ID=MMETSP0156-20130528/42772_1 /TAXON_ID=33649 /ORGANISM="Thalassionema nitzschioides, Strain L26-B" /LENGTH=342 /DNA_ID=CAMNT_0038959747 /DNA_START=138 /DNA_END=1166 /DNA_ORIENTATION=-
MVATITDDPYKRLNLPHNTASSEDIKRSYRQLCKKYHPDTWSAPCFTESEKQRATRQFQKVSAAYELLSDSNQKAEYDRNYKLGLYNNIHNDDDDDDDDDDDTKTKKNHSSSSTTNNNGASSAPPPPPRMGAPPPLPRGWTTAKDPSSGSLYYCHTSTGQSSWHHPSWRNFINSNNNNTTKKTQDNKNNNTKQNNNNNNNDNGGRRGGRKNMFDEGYNYQAYNDKNNEYRNNNVKPENHRCSTFLSLCLCPPIGIIAAYHSFMVDRCWNKSRILPKEQDYKKWRELQDLAEQHSKSCAGYTCLGNTLGIIFWVYMIFIRKEFEWAEDLNKTVEEWLPDDWNK